MVKNKIIIGSRGSKLAILYAEKAKKSILKNNPELFKIAGFKDTSKLGTKLTQVTDIQIQGVKKIIDLEFVCLLSCTIINFS